MTAVNQFNAGTHAQIQGLVTAITNHIPTAITSPWAAGQSQVFSGFDFSFAAGFRITLEVTPDGQTLLVTSDSNGPGPNNAFGPPDGTVPAGGTLQHYDRSPALVVPGAVIT